MNADTRLPLIEIIHALLKKIRAIMQRCDRCILRNRIARIPRTRRVPTPHPERVLRATFQSFHKEPCCWCYPSPIQVLPKDAPSATFTSYASASPAIRPLPPISAERLWVSTRPSAPSGHPSELFTDRGRWCCVVETVRYRHYSPGETTSEPTDTVTSATAGTRCRNRQCPGVVPFGSQCAFRRTCGHAHLRHP